MKDILVDQAGDLRCPDCHGKNFDHKRSLKAKVTLGVVVLPAALLAKKRMKCLNCGTYSKTGNAQRWSDPILRSPAASTPSTNEPTITFTLPPEGSGVEVVLLAANTPSALVVAGRLRSLIPGLKESERKAIAAVVVAGRGVSVARLHSGEGRRLVENMARVGLTAELSSPPPTVTS